jgi:hypothetical protein
MSAPKRFNMTDERVTIRLTADDLESFVILGKALAGSFYRTAVTRTDCLRLALQIATDSLTAAPAGAVTS